MPFPASFWRTQQIEVLMAKPHMKVVVENGAAVWWCNGWTHPEAFTAWYLWWYDGDNFFRAASTTANDRG